MGEEPWTANVAKLAGNFLIASMLEVLGEAFALVRDHFLSAITHGQGEMDWAGLARVMAGNAGLGEPNAMPHAMAH